jgi:2-keto-4-pentenoate hydratase
LRAIQLEFAFRLGKNLDGASGPFDRDRVAAAVVAVIPTIEIADCRFLDWTRVGAPSLIADNAKEGLIVFGLELEAWNGIDLAAERVRLLVNEKTVAEGTGARVLGNPLRSLVWLANDRVRRGDFLSTGQIVSTGTCIDSYYAAPGDAIVAEFESLQPVHVCFARS